MPDREKVIRGLECCALGSLSNCEECPYTGMGCSEHLCADALALLKEQNPPIRCADCRYYEKRCPSEDIGWCNRPGAGCGQPEEFWCAGAERKAEK